MVLADQAPAANLGPDIPADIEPRDLDRDVRAELRALPKGAADKVARHLVAAGRFLDTDPELALLHAQAARTQAARVASVREAVGMAAYHAGQWKLALSELRAWRRFTGSDAHLPLIVDSERALGRLEKALELIAEADERRIDLETRVELLIVGAGIRLDQDDLEGALATLETPELRAGRPSFAVARLRYAYAEMLLGAGRTEQAREWFVAASDADPQGETDAGERVLDLDGFLFTDLDDPDLDDPDPDPDVDDTEIDAQGIDDTLEAPEADHLPADADLAAHTGADPELTVAEVPLTDVTDADVTEPDSGTTADAEHATDGEVDLETHDGLDVRAPLPDAAPLAVHPPEPPPIVPTTGRPGDSAADPTGDTGGVTPSREDEE